MSKNGLKRVTLLLGCLCALLGLSAPLAAQAVQVQGRVVSPQNAPVAGAIVGVDGGTARTTTDAGGEFSISVPSALSTLFVSAPGYSAMRVQLNGRTNVEVRLTPSTVQLEELVVVGYGTQRRQDVTGAVASVRSERLEETPTTNVVQALQGAVPGVQITTGGGGAEGSNNALVIRGRNSIRASNDPLIVVDGIPYNGNLTEINQNDVASIEILKDASSAAIYGSRGSNGVILITTKKGRGEPRFSYEGYMGCRRSLTCPA